MHGHGARDSQEASPRPWRTLLAAGAVALVVIAVAGCAPGVPGRTYSGEEKALMQLQTAGSVWWTGNGSHAVLQAVGEDGRPTVEVWERTTGKKRSLPHYRVVDVEPHAARIWVVPDSRPVPLGVNLDTADPRVIDIAGDGVDSLPPELYVADLGENGEPRADVDARWSAWDGKAGYSASVEIDINKGACPSTLRFYKTGGSLNAWSAKVPTDVVTFEPIGWSPSGEYFAVITQADASATVGVVDAWTNSNGEAASVARPGSAPAKPPTWEADILIFTAADGSLATRQEVTVPVLVPNAGANVAAWGRDNLLWYFESSSGAQELTAVGTMGPLDLVLPRFAGSTQPPRAAWVAGPDGDSLVIARLSGEAVVATDLWRTGGPGDLLSLGTAKGTVARHTAEGGMLSLQPYSANEMGWVVFRADKPGDAQTEIFAVGGPIEPVRAD